MPRTLYPAPGHLVRPTAEGASWPRTGHAVLTRRRLLASAALFVSAGLGSHASARNIIGGVLPWEPGLTALPGAMSPPPFQSIRFARSERASSGRLEDDRLGSPNRVRRRWLRGREQRGRRRNRQTPENLSS